MGMDSKKRLNYHWKLFLPLAALLTFIIVTLVFFQYKREKSFRTDSMMQQMALISDRILNAYAQNLDLEPFIMFLEKYYENSPVNVSIYDSNGNFIFYVGNPIHQTDPDTGTKTEERQEAELTGYGCAKRYSPYNPNSTYLYSSKRSSDGKIFVHTAIPYELSIFEAISSEPSMWIVISVLATIVILLSFYATRYLGCNVNLLRQFANKAASGNNEFHISDEKFPSDELGEISRQIMKLYNEKIIAIKKSEREHSIAINAIEEKIRTKRQLTNNINHELKNPIGIIKGYIDTIVEDKEMSTENMRHFVSKAQTHIVRLCTLLNDLSTLTRLDEGKSNIPIEEVSMHDLAYSIDNDLTTIDTKGMQFSYDIPLNCYVSGNYNLLNDVLLNLVRNSIAYSHGTEMVFNLISDNQEYYTFAFYDNGIGVDEKHLLHLFDRFYRIDKNQSRNAGGTGLGLPIVRNTINSLGGSISVRNRHEGGLEFTFTLRKWKAKTPEHDSRTKFQQPVL